MWAKLNLVWAWSVDTANSPDFWKALVGVATSAGIVISPQQSQAVIAFGMAAMGLLHAWSHVTR